MDLELRGKTALVTGASYGLGYACAESLLQEGAKVAIASRDKAHLEKATDSFSSYRDKVFDFPCDLADRSAIQSLVPRVLEALGGVDILVLSTGHPPTYPFSQASDELWEQGLDLLLWPVITLTRAVLPQMRARGYGRLIYIGSIFGLEPEQSSVIQSTLRTGLNSFAKCVATENAEHGITANVVCPGYFTTPLVVSLAGQYAASSGRTREEVLSEWKDVSPMKKYGKPQDLGAFVSFLASPRAEFISGTTLAMDGGTVKQW